MRKLYNTLKSFFLILLSIIFLVTIPLSAPSPAKDRPFQNGETLKYTLRWLGIPVATMRLSAAGPLNWNEKTVVRYEARFKSIGLLHRLYRVDDRAESLADWQSLQSYRFTLHQKEGSYRASRWNIFEDWQVIYGRPQKPPRVYETFGELNDVLSGLYKARSMNLKPGHQVEVHIFHAKYPYRILLKISRKETVDTLWGPLHALVIEPRVVGKSRLNDLATTWIWATADRYHIPVRMESRTYLGPFVSHLIESHGVPSGRLSAPPQRSLQKWRPKSIHVKEKQQGSLSKIQRLLNRKNKTGKFRDNKKDP